MIQKSFGTGNKQIIFYLKIARW